MRHLPNYSSQQLINLLQRKDKNAFGFLYDTYAPSLFGAISKMVKNDKLATEILKKAFVAIWNESTTLNYPKQNLFVWMYSITYKIAKAELLELEHNQNAAVELVA